MNEVKRYGLVFTGYGSMAGIDEKSDGGYVKLSDFQSERALRIEAETKLAELEDAVEFVAEEDGENEFTIKGGYIISKDAHHPELRKLYNAIANSKARSKG